MIVAVSVVYNGELEVEPIYQRSPFNSAPRDFAQGRPATLRIHGDGQQHSLTCTSPRLSVNLISITGLERMLRDVPAAQFQPLNPNVGRLFRARQALGLDPVG